jgi:hypothetical protein
LFIQIYFKPLVVDYLATLGDPGGGDTKQKPSLALCFFVYPNLFQAVGGGFTSLRSVILGGEIQSKNHR